MITGTYRGMKFTFNDMPQDGQRVLAALEEQFDEYAIDQAVKIGRHYGLQLSREVYDLFMDVGAPDAVEVNSTVEGIFNDGPSDHIRFHKKGVSR